MVLDNRINLVRAYYGIEVTDNWSTITPADVLHVPGVGQVTLDHIRMYLAAKDKTLAGDQTPAFWKEHLSEARICQTMGDDAVKGVNNFRVIVDTRERTPFQFKNIKASVPNKQTGTVDRQPIIVPTIFAGLPTGDYSIEGLESLVCVERKSKEDLYSTLGQNRDRFEAEHVRMSEMAAACVVIECDWNEIMFKPPMPSKLPPASIWGTHASWLIKYNVAWVTMPNREAAEKFTFNYLRMFWINHERKKHGQASRSA